MNMERVPNLPWPHNLFAQPMLTVDSTAPLLRIGGRKELGDNLCACGCKLPHNFAVSRLVGEHGSRTILWYRAMDHRNKHAGVGT